MLASMPGPRNERTVRRRRFPPGLRTDVPVADALGEVVTAVRGRPEFDRADQL